MGIKRPTEADEGIDPRRVPVALPPGASTLLGHSSGERAGGLTWAARFSTDHAAVVALLRRALAVEESPA